MRKSFAFIILIIFCLCVPNVKSADIHEVWPCPDPNINPIKEKISEDAAKAGDIIIVHPGDYPAFTFIGKAITVTSEDPNDPNIVNKTIITGQNQSRVIGFVDGEWNDSVLRGFTIRDSEGLNASRIHCKGTALIIEKCVITNNIGLEICNKVFQVCSNR